MVDRLDSVVQVLTRVFFWVAACLLAAVTVVSSFISGVFIRTLGEQAFGLLVGILVVIVMLCSGFLGML